MKNQSSTDEHDRDPNESFEESMSFQHRFQFRVVSGPHKNETYPVTKQQTVVGRAPECDVVLDREYRMQRRHLVFEINERMNGATLYDLQSGYGVEVDKKRIETSCCVSLSTPFGVGDTTMIIERVSCSAVYLPRMLGLIATASGYCDEYDGDDWWSVSDAITLTEEAGSEDREYGRGVWKTETRCNGRLYQVEQGSFVAVLSLEAVDTSDLPETASEKGSRFVGTHSRSENHYTGKLSGTDRCFFDREYAAYHYRPPFGWVSLESGSRESSFQNYQELLSAQTAWDKRAEQNRMEAKKWWRRFFGLLLLPPRPEWPIPTRQFHLYIKCEKTNESKP